MESTTLACLLVSLQVASTRDFLNAREALPPADDDVSDGSLL